MKKPNNKGAYTIGLIGHEKDDSSYYLNLFPMWDRVEIENTSGINATDIRKEFFLEEDFIPFFLSQEVQTYLTRWKINNPILFNKIKNEFKKLNS